MQATQLKTPIKNSELLSDKDMLTWRILRFFCPSPAGETIEDYLLRFEKARDDDERSSLIPAQKITGLWLEDFIKGRSRSEVYQAIFRLNETGLLNGNGMRKGKSYSTSYSGLLYIQAMEALQSRSRK